MLVTPWMMSEEEGQGDTCVQHPRLYRSNVLSRFIDKLATTKIIGSCVTVPIPLDAKK